MEIASLKQFKEELQTLSSEELVNICLRLSKHKKENKELLHYLLFQASNENLYLQQIKDDLKNEFEEINLSNLYYAKKGLQRINRILSRYLKYTLEKTTHVEALLFFCKEIKELDLPLDQNKIILNLYKRNLTAIDKALSSLHEDIQYDYQEEIKELKKYISKY